jgi:hypothetical protein
MIRWTPKPEQHSKVFFFDRLIGESNVRGTVQRSGMFLVPHLFSLAPRL